MLSTNVVYNVGGFWSNVASAPYPVGLAGNVGASICGFTGVFFNSLMTNALPDDPGTNTLNQYSTVEGPTTLEPLEPASITTLLVAPNSLEATLEAPQMAFLPILCWEFLEQLPELLSLMLPTGPPFLLAQASCLSGTPPLSLVELLPL